MSSSLFSFYMLTLSNFTDHGFNFPIYTDDAQIYVSGSEFSLELQFHSSECLVFYSNLITDTSHITFPSQICPSFSSGIPLGGSRRLAVILLYCSLCPIYNWLLSSVYYTRKIFLPFPLHCPVLILALISHTWIIVVKS